MEGPTPGGRVLHQAMNLSVPSSPPQDGGWEWWVQKGRDTWGLRAVAIRSEPRWHALCCGPQKLTRGMTSVSFLLSDWNSALRSGVGGSRWGKEWGKRWRPELVIRELEAVERAPGEAQVVLQVDCGVEAGGSQKKGWQPPWGEVRLVIWNFTYLPPGRVMPPSRKIVERKMENDVVLQFLLITLYFTMAHSFRFVYL